MNEIKRMRRREDNIFLVLEAGKQVDGQLVQ